MAEQADFFKDEWILNALMDNTGDSIYIKDRECRLRRVSRKMASDLGYKDPANIYGKTDVELFGEEFGKKTIIDDLRIMETGQPNMGLIESYIDKHGSTNWTSTTKLPLFDDKGVVVGLLGITREINELKNSEISFQWLATHDTLTLLANRFLLSDRIEQAIFHAKRNKSLFALLFIDLNGFKIINDKAGHAMGDLYLKKVALALTKNVRSSDTVARIGGDEFVVLLDGIVNNEEPVKVAAKLSEKIRLWVDEEEHSVTAAFGISIFPADGEDAELLLQVADHAMYLSKNNI
jgi:diguanylate cyclase (GGDEF)-like protein/PAS domain S-box-containing protein